MDPSLLKGAKLDAFGQRFVKRGLEDKSSAEYKAHAEIKKLTDWYYNMHLKIARKNIPNDRYYSEFLKQHNKKYVNNYFTRILTKEAREYLNIDKNRQGYVIKDAEKIVDNQIKSYNKKIDKLSSEYSETRGIGKKKEIEKSIRKLERDRELQMENIKAQSDSNAQAAQAAAAADMQKQQALTESKAQLEQMKSQLEIAKMEREAAIKKGSFSSAGNAETNRGKAAGLYIDRKIIKTGKLEDLSEQELENKMKQILSDYEPLLNAKTVEGEVDEIKSSESSLPKPEVS